MTDLMPPIPLTSEQHERLGLHRTGRKLLHLIEQDNSRMRTVGLSEQEIALIWAHRTRPLTEEELAEGSQGESTP